MRRDRSSIDSLDGRGIDQGDAAAQFAKGRGQPPRHVGKTVEIGASGIDRGPLHDLGAHARVGAVDRRDHPLFIG